MKRIFLVLIFTTLLLAGCDDPPKIVSKVEETSKMDSKFERHRLDNYYSILVEKESGICYLEFEYLHGYQGYYGITVMLNPDGTPKIWRD